MVLSLGTAMVYSTLAPALAMVLAIVLNAPARAAAQADPAAKGRYLVLQALPTTAVVFGFVAAFIASGKPNATGLELPLGVLGGAGVVVILIQTALLRSGFPATVAQPQRFGLLLVKSVMPEVLLIFAFVFAFLRISAAN